MLPTLAQGSETVASQMLIVELHLKKAAIACLGTAMARIFIGLIE